MPIPSSPSDVSGRSIAGAAALRSLALLLLLTALSLMHIVVPPFSRRFFCNDESIRYPEAVCSVPYYAAAPVGVLTAWLSVAWAEWCSRDRRHLRGSRRLTAFARRRFPNSEFAAAYFAACLHGVYYFCLGLAACDFLMGMAKNVFGRHRPYFYAACRPQFPPGGCNASVAYHPDEVCRPTLSQREFQDAQRSFPSGHASFGLYCATFIVLYLSRRGASSGSGWRTLPRLAVQFLSAVGGLYMAYSRVPDYKHHWSDVLAGGLLGAVMARLAVSAVPSDVDYDGRAKVGVVSDHDIEMEAPVEVA